MFLPKHLPALFVLSVEPPDRMGGHAAWRKRVANGGLAKGSGGAALRHRPRWGLRGKDLALNRKGNLGGQANPKRKSKMKAKKGSSEQEGFSLPSSLRTNKSLWIVATLLLCMLVTCVAAETYRYFAGLRSASSI